MERIMRIDFVFIGEGPSDEGLVSHLEMLCIEAGAVEVTGIAPDFARIPGLVGRSVTEKIRATMQLEPNANLYFVHRDSDSPDATPRYREIDEAVINCGLTKEHVAVIPVQETEAWLLLDEAAIRVVAGKPSGRTKLNLPMLSSVENLANPKERLQDALIRASGTSGRRLDKFRAQFPTHRRLLLQRLSPNGPVTELSAWRRMRADIDNALTAIQTSESGGAETDRST